MKITKHYEFLLIFIGLGIVGIIARAFGQTPVTIIIGMLVGAGQILTIISWIIFVIKKIIRKKEPVPRKDNESFHSDYVSKTKEIKTQKNNKFLYFLIVIVLIILGLSFYWLQWQPSQIRKECASQAYEYKDADPNSKINSALLWNENQKEYSEALYEKCLHERGL